jgi:site-specific recombinase XerD
MSRLLVQGLAEVDRPAHVDQEGMSACSIHSPAEWGGGDAASNSAAKRSYRHSCSPPVVYYRQSEPVYLVKNCADVEPAPVALSKTEWDAVRRCAEAAARRDHGLALALATLFRYAGPRVSEVAALQIPGVQVSARRGLLIIRRGKGLKHREIPLVQEAREPLTAYLAHRQYLTECWRERARVRGEAVAAWSSWPDGHLFLGQRGPLAERGIREIIAKLGQAAKLASPLGPHDLRHTFAKALLDPAAYGLDRPPMPLPAIQQLLGHADISTTTIYTRVSADDLARMMGTEEAP